MKTLIQAALVAALLSTAADAAFVPSASDFTVTGTIAGATANANVAASGLNGVATLGVEVSGSWSATLTLQCEVNATWTPCFASAPNGSTTGAFSANGTYQLSPAGFSAVRVINLAGGGSGTASVALRESFAPFSAPQSTLGSSTGSPLYAAIQDGTGAINASNPIPEIHSETGATTWTASASGAIAATVMDTSNSGYSTANVVVNSVGVGTYTFYESDDNFATYYAVTCTRADGTNYQASSATYAQVTGWICPIKRRYFEVSLAWTSGTFAGSINYKIPYVMPPQTTLVALQPQTSGGPTVARVLSAASTNASSVKSSFGQVYAYQLCNTSASARYFRFFNKASAPTVGTDMPYAGALLLPAGACLGSPNGIDLGMTFPTGIAYDITGGLTDSDTTAISAADVQGWISYR